MEALKYVEMAREEDEEKRYADFIMHLHSSPMIDPKYREEYMKTIEPQRARKPLTMKTNLEQLKRMKEQQTRERHKKNGGV